MKSPPVLGLVLLALLAGPPAAGAVTLIRGPYLQSGAPHEATIRWRTDVPVLGQVGYALGPTGPRAVVEEAAATTEHVVRLTGLSPATRYFYGVGTATEPLAGFDQRHSFVTPPPPGHAGPTRIWAVGDSGTGGAKARAVYEAYLAYAGGRHTDLWLMLGDNAYEVGSDANYQTGLFNVYTALLPNTFLWPALGNHETYSGEPVPPYVNIFSLPANGEAGGVPSSNELYYSFDHGDIHFVVLDSMLSQRTPDATGAEPPMLTWLKADLADTTERWLIAYWHHPPYSKGSHDSDSRDPVYDAELRQMREVFLPTLEAHGVDLVLAGHSHSYERSYLLGGHYGFSESLTGAMKKDHGSGRPHETGAYGKRGRRDGGDDGQGAVYVVAGSSGKLSPLLPRPHPAMMVSLEQYGSLVIDVERDQLRAVFLRETGAVSDEFVIDKGRPAPTQAPQGTPVLEPARPAGAAVALTWRYPGDDEDGFVIERAAGADELGERARVGANATEFTDREPVTGPARYRVRARNAAGLSPPSNVIAIGAAAPPDAGPAEPGAEPPSGVAPPAPVIPVSVGGGGCDCDVGSGAGPGAALPLVLLALVAIRRRAPLAVVLLLMAPGAARAHETLAAQLATIEARLAAAPAEGFELGLRRAEILRRLGRSEAALAALASLEPAAPARLARIDLVAAEVLREKGEIGAARARLDRAVALVPDDPAPRLARGRLGALVDPARAAEDLAAALALLGAAAHPDDHLRLVRARRAAGDLDGAGAAIAAATRLLGPVLTLELEAIELAVARGRWDEALARIDARAAVSVRKEAWLLRRAHVLAAAGRPRAAVRALAAASDALASLPAAQKHAPATRAMAEDVARTRAALGGSQP